jgi:lysine biosynthesis protein LysW
MIYTKCLCGQLLDVTDNELEDIGECPKCGVELEIVTLDRESGLVLLSVTTEPEESKAIEISE